MITGGFYLKNVLLELLYWLFFKIILNKKLNFIPQRNTELEKKKNRKARESHHQLTSENKHHHIMQEC
jgi:hypothetical protein